MKTILRTVLFMLALLPLSASAVSFQTTTIEGGQFAENTPWYTMTIGNSHLLISNPGTATYIALNSTLRELSDDNLWCFVGNETDGYVIYNKAAGTGKVLSAPTAMTGNTGGANEKNGGDSYVVLRPTATSNSGGYTDKWIFASSNNITGETGWYMYEKGYTANKVNNRNGKLAFWTAGQDAGSTLVISLAKQFLPVNLTTGTFTATNAAGTYFRTWTSTQTDPQVTLTTTKNNINYLNPSDNTVWVVSPNNGSNVYSISASNGYNVTGFGFEFCSNNGSTAMTVTSGSTSVTANSSTYETFAVSGIEEKTVQFVITPTGTPAINVKNIYVTVERSFEVPEKSVELFVTQSGQIPYRIPAIATMQNGDIIAVSDYRYCRADIGNGRIDLYSRISHDNGETWDPTVILAQGDGKLVNDDRNQSLTAGYGDACIVADRESPRVLMMSVCGYQTFPNGTRSIPNQVARWYSNDNGQTWTGPEVITEMFYTPFDTNCSYGPIRSMFIGSGKIHQSRYVKVGQYYRLYCSMLAKSVSSANINYVIYSDDFGETWKVLGDINTPPIPSGADEPKTEELPDGSVVVSSRCTGGRYFNIFTFTDAESAQGSWGTHAFSGASNNGVTAQGNSCNGELLIIPALRRADNKQCYLALQSLPFGNGRANVGIYYKELSSFADDYADPATFAKNWDGRHQSSTVGSAYSTMVMQHDDKLGFLYEESTYGADYTIVYKPYSIEQITDSAYSYVRPEDFVSDIHKATFNIVDKHDNILATAKSTLTEGETLTLPASLRRAYCTYTMDATTMGNTDMTVKVNYTFEPPFIVSTDLNAPVWYYMNIRDNRWCQYNTGFNESAAYSTGSSSCFAVLTQDNYVAGNNTYMWAISGDPYTGIRVYNKAVGTSKALAATTDRPTFTTEGTDWIIAENGTGFTLHALNSTSYVNEKNYAPTALFYWSDTRASTDVGSTFHLVKVADPTLTLTAEYGTLCSANNLDFNGNELEAYVTNHFEDNKVILTRIYSVPAGTGVVVKGEAGRTYTLPVAASAGYTTNLLVGTLSDIELSQTEGTNSNFILSDGSRGIGFYLVDSDGGTLAAGKAYLQLPTATVGSTRAFTLSFEDDVTGIGQAAATANQASAWFDLQGRRVSQPRRGIYVRNGVKQLFK